jgi:type IV pilus assembly PilO-like protein
MITARDRKIIAILVPLLLVAGYWFMALAPKRAESQKTAGELTKAQTARDTAMQQVAELNAAKASFADDYATVIRLGKAVPTTVDMPSLLVQIDRAARGTGIRIDDFKPGQPTTPQSAGTGPTGGAAAPSASGTAPGGGNTPAAPGAPPAQSFPGKQAQKAGNGVTQANNQNQANADKAGGVAGAASPTGAAAPSAPGLVSVPLTFTMTGDFFSLADFFHRMKRFVRVANGQIVVRGRLMTIDSFNFQDGDADATGLKADVSATIYLTPADQGTTAGATSQGPAGAAAGASSPSTPPSSTSTSTPTATATP